jgi:5-methylcytosine-specific restriction endonuclease McrA
MSVLVLNSAYLPIQTTSIKKAIKLIYRGVAVAEKYTNEVWKSISSEILLPAVIRLVNFHRLPNKSYKLSKKNVLVRDKYICQYCSGLFSERILTLDHVIPKSRGGSSKWENLVAACRKCNAKKADRTPQEAGMVLLSKPTKLTIHTHTTILRNKGESRPEWSEFLFH